MSHNFFHLLILRAFNLKIRWKASTATAFFTCVCMRVQVCNVHVCVFVFIPLSLKEPRPFVVIIPLAKENPGCIVFPCVHAWVLNKLNPYSKHMHGPA